MLVAMPCRLPDGQRPSNHAIVVRCEYRSAQGRRGIQCPARRSAPTGEIQLALTIRMAQSGIRKRGVDRAQQSSLSIERPSDSLLPRQIGAQHPRAIVFCFRARHRSFRSRFLLLPTNRVATAVALVVPRVMQCGLVPTGSSEPSLG